MQTALTPVHRTLTTLENMDELDRLFAESADRPLLLFKHSHTCGVSAEALDELSAYLADAPADIRYAIITVQTHRALSTAVAARLGIRHETPQAILVRDSRAVWTASHFRLTADALQKALG